MKKILLLLLIVSSTLYAEDNEKHINLIATAGFDYASVSYQYDVHNSNDLIYRLENDAYTLFSPIIGLDISAKIFVNIGVDVSYQYMSVTSDETGDNYVKNIKHHNFMILPYVCTPEFFSSEFSLAFGVTQTSINIEEPNKGSAFTNDPIISGVYRMMLSSYKGKKGFIYELQITKFENEDEVTFNHGSLGLGRVSDSGAFGAMIKVGATDYVYEGRGVSEEFGKGWIGVRFIHHLM